MKRSQVFLLLVICLVIIIALAQDLTGIDEKSMHSGNVLMKKGKKYGKKYGGCRRTCRGRRPRRVCHMQCCNCYNRPCQADEEDYEEGLWKPSSGKKSAG